MVFERLKKRCFVMGMLFTGSGCAALPKNPAGVEAGSPALRILSPAPAPADSKAARSASLERDAYVCAVLKANPSIESARQAWLGARARQREAGSFDDPMVSMAVAPLSIGSSKARFGYEVGISQSLPWFGKRGFEREAMTGEAEATKSDLETTRRDLALASRSLYAQRYLNTRALEINSRHIELMRLLRDGATAQFETGRASAQDPLQAEAELTHLEHDRVILESERDVDIAQMNELLHRHPRASLPPLPSRLALGSAPGAGSAERFESEAARERPEIRAARQRARSASARAKRADRESYPNFNVSTSYSTMWDMPEHRWMVGLAFNLPVQLERRAGTVEEANASRAEFESEAKRLTDRARTEAYVAYRKLRESEHVLRLFESRLLPVARDQVAAARAGFTASQNSFVAVVDAARNLRGVELSYEAARAEADRRAAELDRALGRDPDGYCRRAGK